MYNFNVVKATNECIQWIREWFEDNGKGCNAVIGISGGKDSSCVAALLCKALGRERVFGVLMPQGEQTDINYSLDLCQILGIDYTIVNIKNAVDSIINAIDNNILLSKQTKTNLPSRIRMCTLYAISQSKDGRVANTCNLSEDWVGYSTRYGDSVGDFSPISCFTVTEVKAICKYLNLPTKFIEKPPLDGLSGKTDEENLGFTYTTLDKYIREGIEPPYEQKERIDYLHKANLFKLKIMPAFKYEGDE